MTFYATFFTEDFANPWDIFERLSVMVYRLAVRTGMKVKVLEAMAYGISVVVNRHGAERLKVDPATGVRVTTTDDETSAAVLQLCPSNSQKRPEPLLGVARGHKVSDGGIVGARYVDLYALLCAQNAGLEHFSGVVVCH